MKAKPQSAERMTRGVDRPARPALRLLDVNRDGVIGMQDIAILLANWGRPDHDVTGDGTVAAQDVAAVLAGWGEISKSPSEAGPKPHGYRIDGWSPTVSGRHAARQAARRAGTRETTNHMETGCHT